MRHGTVYGSESTVYGSQPTTTDVLVVGAGLTGLSCAHHLHMAGLGVHVVESETVGAGQTGVSGGQVLPGFEAEFSVLRKVMSAQTLRSLISAVHQSQHELRSLMSALMPEHLDGHGNFITALTRKHVEELHEYAEEARGYGTSYEWCDRSRLYTELGTYMYMGGLYDRDSFHINPLGLVQGLAKLNHNRITEHCRVLGMKEHPHGFEVQTTHGEITARHVVMAGGVNMEPLVAPNMSPIIPVTTFVASTGVLPHDLRKSIIPSGACVYDARDIMDYFRVHRNRLLIGGADAIGASPEVARAYLSRRMVEIFPQLAGQELTNLWSGECDVSFNQAPCFEKRGNMFITWGFSGHGLNLAFLTGKAVTGKLTGRDSFTWDTLSRLKGRSMPRVRVLQKLVARIGVAVHK